MPQADFYPGDGEHGVVVHKPHGAWVGNAFVFLDEEGEDRARVDENGGAGFQAIHVSPGTNTEGTYPGAWGYGFHLDPKADVTGFILDNTPLTDPDGNPLSATKDYVVARNRRVGGNPTEFRISKDRYIVSKKNAAPAAADLAVGEFTMWFDPAGAGAFKMTGKKNDGTLKTQTL